MKCIAMVLLTILWGVSYLLCQELPSGSEVFLLKNGDKISGQVQGFDYTNSKVIVKNDAVGDVQIPWDQIQAIQSTRILYFRLKNDNIIAGVAGGMEGGKQIIHSVLLGKTLIPRDEILIVGLDEKSVSPEFIALQKKYEEEKEAHRKASEIGEIWSGYLQAYFSGNEGNKNDRSFSGTGHLERKTDFERFVAQIDLRYTEARRRKTTSQVEGFLKEDIDVTSWLYVWGQLSGKWDEINGIDLRFRAEIGLGIHFLKPGQAEIFKGDKIALRWELGAQFTNTDYDNSPDTHTGGFVTRILYNHEFIPFEESTKPWMLEIMGEYYQSLVEPQNRPGADFNDDYTLKGLVALIVPVSSVISFSARIWDEYNNITDSPDKKRNDFYWDLGIRITI